MRFPLAVGVLVAVGVAAAAPVPKKGEKPDAEAIQGTWVLDKFEGDDEPPPGVVINFTKDGKMGVELGGMAREKGGYKLDPKTKPKSIDLTNPDREITLGIYELDGDTLKICIVEGKNAARPTEFKAVGKKVMVLTLKRVKDK